jgi:hypothetical protein
VVIGSVKSNVGHTKCASGMASLIKAAKAAYHGVLPPTLHIRQPIETWDAETSPFVFLDQARPWITDRRMVAVSSFGFGGTNFHAILDEPPSPASSTGRPHWPSELFAFRSPDQVAALAERLAAELAPPRQADRWRLRDIAAAVNADGDHHGPVVVAVVADDLDDLAAKLDAASAARSERGVYSRGNRSRPAGDEEIGPGGRDLFPHPPASGTYFLAKCAADLLVAFPRLRELVPAGHADVLVPPQAFDDTTRAAQEAALGDVADAGRAIVTQALAAFGLPAGDLAGEPGEHGLTALLHVVAQAAVAGASVALAALSTGRDCRPERWRDPPRPAGWIVNGHFARAASGASLPKGLHPATEAPDVDLFEGVAAPAGVDPADLAVVAEYLKIVQGMIATGSEIIRSQVGGP